MEKTVLVVGFLLLTASAIAVTNVAVNSGILEALGLTITGDATVSGKVTAAELHAGQYCDAGINCKAYADIGTGNLPACAAGEFVYMNASGKWDCYNVSAGGLPGGGDIGEASGSSGDLTTGGAATASDIYPGYPASLAFDGSYDTFWHNMNTLPSWLQYDFGSQKTVREYQIIPHCSYMPTSWTLYGSNDGTNFVDEVDSRAGQSWGTCWWKSYTVARPGAYRYYRFVFTASSNPNWMVIREIAMFDKVGLMEPYASDTYSAGYEPSLAFDGSYDTFWHNMNLMPSWLEYDFGTRKTIREYEMIPHCSYIPTNWALYGSNDGTNYENALDSRASQSWGTCWWKAYTVAHPGAYRFYRFVFATSANPNWMVIRSIKMEDYAATTNPSASDTYSAGYEPSLAFDGDSGTFWHNMNLMPSWLQKDFGTPTTFNHYTISPHLSYTPSAWTLYGSTDGTDWSHMLDSEAGHSSWPSASATYDVNSPGAYRFYRFVFTTSNNPNWMVIREISFS